MRHLLLLAASLAVVAAAGCSTHQAHVYEYQAVRLEAKATVVPAGTYLAAAELDPAVYYAIDFAQRQVLVDVRLLSADRTDQSLLGVSWWPGSGDALQPSRIEDKTERSSPVSVGFGFGVGGGGRSGGGAPGHGPGCTCAQCRGGGGGDRAATGGNVGIGIPIPLPGQQGVNSVRAVFDLPGSVDTDQSYLGVLVQMRRLADDGSILAQPILLSLGSERPAEVEAGPEPDVRQAFTTVKLIDGRTVTLGGLLPEEQTDIRSKVPMLGDVPLVGRLFKTEAETIEPEPLVIFVRPTILLRHEDEQ